MKKAIVFILLLTLTLSTLIAEDVYSGSDPFTVYGYYNPGQITQSITLSITKSGNKKVSNGDTIDWTKPNSGYKNVFDWKATGNFNGNVTVSFTVTPLVALLDDYYYIPGHSIKSTTPANSELVASSTDFTGNPPVTTFTSGHSRTIDALDFRSREIVYSGSKTAPLNSSWSESGTFALEVTEYNQLYGGTFNYISTVTIELTVDAVQGGGQ